MYHCHQEADIHVQMGMYGALVVYSADKADPTAPTTMAGQTGVAGKGRGTLWGWQYDKDVVLLESEIGTDQHVSEEISGDYNPVDYKPQYWFLNGLSFPNTIHVGLPGQAGADWIAAHPGYDPLITGSVSARKLHGSKGEKVLIRMINMGYETQPMHMHGYHGKVIGSDQRAWTWANSGLRDTPWGKGLEKNTLTIGSGETYEWLVDFSHSPWPRHTRLELRRGTTRLTNLPCARDTQTGSPAIGSSAPLYRRANGDRCGGYRCTSQVFPFHNHDDYKATNNGVYPGGMFTALIPTP